MAANMEMIQEAEQAMAEPDPDEAYEAMRDREADADWRWAKDWD